MILKIFLVSAECTQSVLLWRSFVQIMNIEMCMLLTVFYLSAVNCAVSRNVIQLLTCALVISV